VEGFIRNAQIVSDKQLSDRSYEVILQLPMVGDNGLTSEIKTDSESDDTPAGKSESSPNDPNLTEHQSDDPSGVIIDARGFDIKPAMSPKIYDEDGREVYGTIGVSPDYAVETGIAVYPRSLDEALKSPRAGSHPIVVKALSRGRQFSTDVVVSNADAAIIRDGDHKTGFLSRCRVSIVIGPGSKR
jgi:hypothetical protein